MSGSSPQRSSGGAAASDVEASDEPIVTLLQCKHVDRTTKRMQCTAQLHLRPHTRGYLAVACECGHQWVWCQHCCDCGLGTRGCIKPAHWMERDSFDTGKRNHMQQHASQPRHGHRVDGCAPLPASETTLDVSPAQLIVTAAARVPVSQTTIGMTLARAACHATAPE